MKKTVLCLWGALGLSSFAFAQTTKENDFKILKYNNPGLNVDLGVGLWAWPLPMDYDNDGDMDLLVSSQGKPFNGLIYLRIRTETKSLYSKNKKDYINRSKMYRFLILMESQDLLFQDLS